MMDNTKYIYLDNASTSFPKPHNLNKVFELLSESPATYNRRGYSSIYNLNNIIESTRQRLKRLINCPNENKLIFTLNSTQAINIGLRGILKSGDHVITTNFEHAAVSRTLTALKKANNVDFSIIDFDGMTSSDDFEKRLIDLIKPNTKMVIINHGSNVTGELLYKPEYGEIVKKYNLFMFVDSSQTIGNVEINIDTDNIDIMAFSCHKSLLGFTGVGALYFNNDIKIDQIITGGTGIRSESDEIDFLEESDYETGTINIPGLLSLNYSLEFINSQNLTNIIKKKKELTKVLVDKLQNIKNVKIYGDKNQVNRLPIVSFNIEGLNPVNEVGPILENAFNIVTRTGLHCSPWAHKKIGTFPEGTIRVSPGYFNTLEDIDKLIDAISIISNSIES